LILFKLFIYLFYIDFVSEIKDKDGITVYANDYIDEIGNVESNRFQVLAVGKAPSFYHEEMTEEKQPQTGAHEIGHGLGLRHEVIGTDESIDGISVPEGNLMRGWSGGQGLEINMEQLRKIESILPEEEK